MAINDAPITQAARINLETVVKDNSTAENIAGDLLGIIEAQVHGDLGRIKQLIDSRTEETGARRGNVQDGDKRQSESQLQPPGTRATVGPLATSDFVSAVEAAGLDESQPREAEALAARTALRASTRRSPGSRCMRIGGS